MFGNFPRLETEIQFFAPSMSIVINPYTSVTRFYSVQDQALNIRCTMSYKDETDLLINKKDTETLNLQIEGKDENIESSANKEFLQLNVNKLLRK